MIVGIGVDVVDIDRFERALRRTPQLASRLFSDRERLRSGRPLPFRSLAGRYAAKEALIKALGDSSGVAWHDICVVADPLGNPAIELSNSTKVVVERRGITSVHLSMSHDAGIAIAYVIAESNKDRVELKQPGAEPGHSSIELSRDRAELNKENAEPELGQDRAEANHG